MESTLGVKQEPIEEEEPSAMEESPAVENKEDREVYEDDVKEDEEKGSDRDDAVEAQYAVEGLRDVKRGQYKKLWFLVKWEGYPEDQNTWVEQDELQGDAAIKEMIEEFKRTQPDLMAKVATKPRKPKAEKYVLKVVEPTHDSSGEIYDRELTDSDAFYGQQAGELKGELRGLYDPSHKVSSKELILAKINSEQRITRRGARHLDLPATSGRGSGVNSPAPSTPSPVPKRKSTTRKTARKSKEKATKTTLFNDDLYSAEDDGQETSQDVPEEPESVIETARTPSKETQKRRASRESQSDQKESGVEAQEKTVLDGCVLRKTINFFTLKPLAKFPEPININTIRKYVIAPDGTKMKSIYATLSQKESEQLFTRRDPKTGENWLHLMIQNNDKCGPSHELDCVLRVFTHEYDQLLNEVMPVNGYTPLHMAVEKNMGCTVRTMLCYPQNLNAKTKKDETALAIAIRKNNPLITKFLLEAGANFTELQGKCKRDSSEAAVAVNQHVLRFKRITDEARERFLSFNNLEEMAVCSSMYRHLGNTSATFQFKIPNFQPYKLPDTSFTYLLFIYVCAINGESWSARCTGDFRQAAAPTLNGRPLIHAQDSIYPLVYFCPLQKGHNTVELKGMADTWKLYPILAAHVVLVRDRPQVVIPPVVEHETPLEVAPLVGPI